MFVSILGLHRIYNCNRIDNVISSTCKWRWPPRLERPRRPIVQFQQSMHPVTSHLPTSYSRVAGKLCTPKSEPAITHLHQALHSPVLPPPLPQPEIRLLGLCQYGVHHLLGNLYLDREPQHLPPHCLFL
jgi:hypothetical protein